MDIKRGLLIISCLSVLLLTFAVYHPGLSGPFIFDDWPGVVQDEHIRLNDLDFWSLKQAAFSGTSGMLGRPVSMLSFALNYYAAGMSSYSFKLVNVFIHLANGIGVYVMTCLLLGANQQRIQPSLSEGHIQWVSLMVAAAWLLHPLNLTGVLYVVQRMASLSSFFMIWGIVFYLLGRKRLYEGSGGKLFVPAALLIFTFLAVFSKENGALLPLLVLIVEVVFFGFKTARPTDRNLLVAIFGLFVLIPAAVALVFLARHPDWLLNVYSMREFSLSERLLTETRVLWIYLKMIVVPTPQELGIFHDDIALSRSFVDPIGTLISAVGLAALLGASWLFRKRLPILSFGLQFYFAGHIMESTLIPLEIAYEHRNYLPMYGILLPLFYYSLLPSISQDTLRLRQVAAVLFVGLLATVTSLRAQQWGNMFDLSQAEVDHHPNSARANTQMGVIYKNLLLLDESGMDTSYVRARDYFEKATMQQKNFTVGLFELINLSSVKNKPIEKIWLSELNQRLAHAPFATNSGNALVKLEACQVKGDCKLSNKEMDELLRAALRNPTLQGLSKGAVLFALADHIHYASQDDATAIRLAYQAVEAAPQILQYRLTLVQFLIGLRKFDLARQQLELMKQQDKMQTYMAAIEQYEKMLISELDLQTEAHIDNAPKN